MAEKNSMNVLSEEFLMDLFRTCMNDSYILSVVYTHIKPEHLPDRDSITLFKALKKYYGEYKKVPSYSAIRESISGNKNAIHLLNDIYETTDGLETKECVKLIEEYLLRVNFQKAYKAAGEAYNKEGFEAASQVLIEYTEWAKSFSLSDSDFTNIVETFAERFQKNRMKHNSQSSCRPITRFYIDELDVRNAGRELRTQLTCFLAPTGIGKTHAARWVGRNACLDGYNVLHIQLEGNKEEVENAYSASLVTCNSFRYEHGTLRDSDFDRMVQELKSVSGKLFVRSYPKFNSHVSTIDVKEAIAEFKEKYGITPDILIIDSMDLLTDASGRKYGENGERHRRIAVANDLKDIAADENVWVVVTYQSTIESQEWLNDEKNVLTEYNTAEAKGLARPLTHLITLNQSLNERKEHTMRINVAKSRFFERGDVFKIATDYDNEIFYDRQRTININKVK